VHSAAEAASITTASLREFIATAATTAAKRIWAAAMQLKWFDLLGEAVKSADYSLTRKARPTQDG
jgi:hypothetical protein